MVSNVTYFHVSFFLIPFLLERFFFFFLFFLVKGRELRRLNISDLSRLERSYITLFQLLIIDRSMLSLLLV